MNHELLNILKWILKKLARLTVWRYNPGIIGITGSVGKTSTKLALAAILGSDRRVRASSGNFNNEIGLPLTVLGDYQKISSPVFFWPKVLIAGLFRLIFKSPSYPEILILEYGVDRPGDLKYLLEIVRPNIGIITAIGDIPVHVEFFSGPIELAKEKARLIEILPAAGYAVLNADDETVMNLKERTRAHLMTFGFCKEAEVRITSFENRVEADRPMGISFKLEYGGSFVPVRLDAVFGKAQAYAAAAAASVGLIFGLNLVKISEALRDYRPAGGRMNLLAGIKYSYILDDSYNASPLSTHAALDTLKSLPAKRKIAALGDMLEIGQYSLEAHERVGRLAAGFLDFLITIGPRAKFIAEAARQAKMPKNHIFSFDTAEEAVEQVKSAIKKGDLILVKASRAMHLEKITEEIKAF